MRKIFVLVFSAFICVGIQAQPKKQTILKIETTSTEGVLMQYTDKSGEQKDVRLQGPSVQVVLGEKSTLSVSRSDSENVEQKNLKDLYELKSVELEGQYLIEIKDVNDNVNRLWVTDATIRMEQ